MKKSLLILLIILNFAPVFSQENPEPENQQAMDDYPRRYSEVGIGAGGFLPFGIFSVRMDYPAWWVYYGHNLASWRVEYRLHHVNSQGVTWYAGSVSLGGAMDLYELTRVAFYVGLTQHYYKPSPTNLRELPWATTTGMHVGAAPMFSLGGPVYLRADFQMNFGPGQSLFAGIGFSYLF